jgi:hypothetical protein
VHLKRHGLQGSAGYNGPAVGEGSLQKPSSDSICPATLEAAQILMLLKYGRDPKQ